MKFIAVLADNVRSQAYLQTLVKQKILPHKVIILKSHANSSLGVVSKKSVSFKNDKYFFKNSILDTKESLIYTLRKNNISHETVNNSDINSDIIFKKISNCKNKIILVSVFAGQILKTRILQTKKKFLHIHPGKLPEYRGSTTIYYSLLQTNKVAATAIFLNEEIDKGNIICSKEYKFNFDAKLIDLVFDPLLRAEVLVTAMKLLSKNKNCEKTQNHFSGTDYFIIHPILKHLAILKEEK